MLTDILKQRGIFSKEIKSRFAQKQIKVNGLVVSEDFDIGDVEETIDIGNFVFSLMRNNIWALRIRIFGLEDLMSASNIKNDLTEFLKGFLIVRTSKKDVFVIKRKHKQM
jgi:hypothetical protein